ncbi:MAG: HD domain-containing protein [Planctomycetota bacterium]|nr:HD domain-containing protein [Planctomycetota bacterium]
MSETPGSLSVDDARTLMHEWVESPALRGHMEAVAACMADHAALHAPDEVEAWTVAGLLHDFDYERHPTLEEHPTVGVAHLRTLGVDETIREAILGHAPHTGVARTTSMARHLFACDELAGFIVAVARVRPTGFEGLKARSVRKKLKDKAFAAAVSRADIAEGVADLISDGCVADENEHIDRCIAAIGAVADRVVG